MFTASMGIAICKLDSYLSSPERCTDTRSGGDRFTSRTDQEALLKVLMKTEREHARPTALVQEQMKRSWGWDFG